MYFVVNLKNGYIDFLKDIISISMNDLHEIDFKTTIKTYKFYRFSYRFI